MNFYHKCLFIVICFFILLTGFRKKVNYEVVNKVDKIVLLDPGVVPVLAQNFVNNNVQTNIASNSTVLGINTVYLQKSIKAGSFFIGDLNNNVLTFKDKDKPMYPASTTKLMTALVALDFFDKYSVLTVPQQAICEGHKVGLVPGEKLFFIDLLKAMLISSGNDAAITIAYSFPGGIDAFVAKMNDYAKKYGLNNTHFTNPVGFDEPFHQTTAYDLYKLSLVFLKNDLLKMIVNTRSTYISDVENRFTHELVNTNKLLFFDSFVKGVKTGTSPLAKQVLITYIEKNTVKYVIVIMGSENRFDETLNLIKYINTNFKWVSYKDFDLSF